MFDNNMASLANKLQELDLYVKNQRDQELGYCRALRHAIVGTDLCMELEVLKSLGDLHLHKGKRRKDSAEFDKASALYAAALRHCTDPDMGQTLVYRIDYIDKVSKQLLQGQGYSLQYKWMSPDYWGCAESNVLRVAEICNTLDQKVEKQNFESAGDTYTYALVAAIADGNMLLEQEVLKCLGDLYLDRGKVTCHMPHFCQADALYDRALVTCHDDLGKKETLHHRIKYTDKISNMKAKVKHPLPAKLMQTGSRPATDQNFGVIIGKHYHHLHMLRQYQTQMRNGNSSLARADLNSAEKHFAEALKIVHVRDSTTEEYQREVEPLCKLGDVYSKRGQQTGDGGDFVKAAALYNAAIPRSEDQVLNDNTEIAMKEVEESFLKCILDIHVSCQDDTDKHKKQLKEMRDQIKLEMETIDQQLDPYVHDEDDPCVAELEAKRAQAVRQLFERIASERKQFVSQLVEECIGLMGPPPCKYALMGLGSQATELVTPYSDLEFAILVEAESDQNVQYFCKFTHFLHLKVVNLGETILPSMGIKSLNDFYSENPLDNWYYDSVTPRGFAFDGSMPRASKTPLGRQGTKNEPPSELICTPENMVSKLENDATLYLTEGYHLATVLRNPCLIAGDQDLVNIYMAMLAKKLQADSSKIAIQMVQETLKENIRIYNDKETVTAKLIHVKKDIYRLPSLAVDCLALSSCIIPTTVWKTIEEMQIKDVLSAENAHHIKVFVSISAELRLKTYIANNAQRENLSALASLETVLHRPESFLQTKDDIDCVNPVFHPSHKQQIFRYYYTAIPLKECLSKLSQNEPVLHSDLYDASPNAQALMFCELFEYRQAISYFDKAIAKSDEGVTIHKSSMLNNLGHSWYMLGDSKKAIRYLEEALAMRRIIYGQSAAHPEISNTIGGLGLAWHHMGEFRKAISYHEEALRVKKRLYGQNTEHPDIAASLLNVGTAWHDLGDDKKAISYYEQVLQMLTNSYGQTSAALDVIAGALANMGVSLAILGDHSKAINCYERALLISRKIYGGNTAHPDIATALHNLGVTWTELGDNQKAINYIEQALWMLRSVYGQEATHPDIANSLNSLGQAWDSVGDHVKSISYGEQASKMVMSIHGQNTTHPHLANSLLNVGQVWHHLGDYKKAVSYIEKAVEMNKRMYGQGTAHPIVAGSLNSLASVWSDLGKFDKAILYYEQALQMYRSVYGLTKAHPDIARSLTSLGAVWGHLGRHREGIAYHEQALQMFRIIYGESTAHPHTAATLRNLGGAWHALSDCKSAIPYYEQALQMYRGIHGQTTELEIAKCLNNLGGAWENLGNYRKAIIYHEEALKTRRSIYGRIKCTAHRDIAMSLNNLGLAWHHLCDYKNAISYYEQALQMYRTVYGQMATQPEIAFTLNNLGAVWENMGNYSKAITYQEKALQMRKRVYGQNTAHPEIATSLNGIGVVCQHLGNHTKAIDYYEQALQMYRSIYGPNRAHFDITMSLNNLGGAWSDLHNYKKAIEYHEEALQMLRSVYGDSAPNPFIALSLFYLGSRWREMGDCTTAISYYEQALAMYSNIYGKNTAHAYVATLLNNLGEIWSSLGSHRKAISYHEQALQMKRTIYGKTTAHPAIVKSLNNIGLAWHHLGDHRKAISICQEALSMAKKIYPQDSSSRLY